MRSTVSPQHSSAFTDFLWHKEWPLRSRPPLAHDLRSSQNCSNFDSLFATHIHPTTVWSRQKFHHPTSPHEPSVTPLAGSGTVYLPLSIIHSQLSTATFKKHLNSFLLRPKMTPITASGGFSRERFRRGSRNFTRLSRTIGYDDSSFFWLAAKSN